MPCFSGMSGANSIEQLLIDQVVDTVNDLLTDIFKPVFEQDATKKV
jgi:hypothetical protein